MSGAEVVIAAVTAVAVIIAMEPWSRIVHERFWHKVLYRVHQTHHPAPNLKSPPTLFEANDIFSILHALPAIALLSWGLTTGTGVTGALAVGIGAGMSLYGMTYMVIHDGLAHGRLPVKFLMRWRWVRRIRAAHEIHHRTGGAPYGLFLGPQELQAAARRGRQVGGETSAAG